MPILITTSRSIESGSVGGDDIDFLDLNGSSLTSNGFFVDGGAGNDTIATNASGISTVSAGRAGPGLIVEAGGGDDSIQIFVRGGTTSADNVNVLGEDGNDTITVGDGGSWGAFGKVAGGAGDDQIIVQSSYYSGIYGGAGNDTIELTGTQVNVNTSMAIGGGAGDDVISAGIRVRTWRSAGIFGGGGADTITISAFSSSGAFINGDSIGHGGGADSISVNSQGASTIIRGKGGADTITVKTIGVSAVIAGNAGGDVITVSGSFGDDASIKGGAGGDCITLDDADLTNTSGGIYGGGGNDTICFADAVIDNTGITINGGAGVDSIRFSGTIADNTDLGILEISDLGDSRLGAVDTMDLTGIAAGTDATLELAAGTALDLGTTAETLSAIDDVNATEANTTGFFSAVSQSGSVDDGAMSFSGQASASVATAALNADAVTRIGDSPSAGRAVLFTAGSDEYLFVQGGSAGTDDDYIMKFNGVSGSTFTAKIFLKGDA